jgi:hypothetical protein
MHQAFITVGYGIGGFFAVSMEWDEEAQQHLPGCTADVRWPHKYQAEVEAKEWAEAENLRYLP